MSFWTLDRLGEALGQAAAGRPWAREPRAIPSGRKPLGAVSTDTRTLRAGDVFVAIRGERFDGHEFLADAATRGASAVVVEHPQRAAHAGLPVFAVDDTTAALGALATYRRRMWGGPLIAVAGSNGKTTTRELIRRALDGALCVHATQGNLNNQVGVPLTLLAVPDTAEVAVVEFGTNHPGEVEVLRRIARPDIAVVTSIGEEHLEGLVDLAGVLREETSVYRDAEVAVAPASQSEVGEAARRLARQTVEAGLDRGDVHPEAWGMDAEGFGWAEFGTARLSLGIRGAHNLRNAMLAIAVARACGVSLEDAAAGVARATPLAMRGTVVQFGSLTVINDAYNANPASMREAIAMLDGMPAGRQRVLVLGGMRELGPGGPAWHDSIARHALSSRADVVAGIGDFAVPLAAQDGGGRTVTAADVEALWPLLEARLARDAVVLLKASRGVQLERIVPYLERWAAM